MHREQINRISCSLIISALFLTGCFSILTLPAAAESQPDPSATVSDIQTPAETTTPDFLQNLITAFRNLIFRPNHGNTNAGSQTAGTGSTGNGSGDTQKVIATYYYLFEPSYNAAIADGIPWKKINRLYIAFATVHDGILTDLPAGSSQEDLMKREESERKIRNIIALCRQGNPDAEIFISSNFGGDLDDQYLQAAQDPQKFADSVVDYMQNYGLDGYDMDWESRQINDYAPQLTTLLSTCQATFKKAGDNPHGHAYKLTHAVWPGVESPETIAGLKDSVDQINIMSYGPGDCYDLASYADSYDKAGFPYDKMIAGLESELEYLENDGPDTETSVAAKCAYVKANNLAGLFVWRMDNDMRTPDGNTSTFPITGWMHDCMAG